MPTGHAPIVITCVKCAYIVCIQLHMLGKVSDFTHCLLNYHMLNCYQSGKFVAKGQYRLITKRNKPYIWQEPILFNIKHENIKTDWGIGN